MGGGGRFRAQQWHCSRRARCLPLVALVTLDQSWGLRTLETRVLPARSARHRQSVDWLTPVVDQAAIVPVVSNYTRL